MKPALSCVIITLNEEKNLPKLLDSLKRQTFKDFEVIVADYNSKDKTREIAKAYRCKLTQGGDYSTGRNNGAKVAKADYLLFLDADSIFSRRFLEINFKKFKQSRKGTGTSPVEPISKKIVDRLFFKGYDYWSILMSKISPHCAGCAIFSTKKVFNLVGGFDPKIVFAENQDFTRRARKYGFIIVPEPVFTSVRRMDQKGRFRFFLEYVYTGLYRVFYKEINKELFEYTKVIN